jgi:general secretion pathway protein K
LILREDARNSTLDDLSEPWAIPLAPTRLDQYVESGAISGGAGSAVLSGGIQDAQGRFNLTSLATQDSINQSEVEAFGRLLALLRQDPALANVIAQQIAAAGAAALNPRPDSVRPIGFVQLDDLLAVPGCTPQLISAIRTHAVILPVSTPVNINTASPEVLAARVPGLSLADANTLTNSRRQAAFRDTADLAARLPNRTLSFDGGRLGVASNFFIVTGRVTIRSATLQIQALVERQPSATRLLWVKEI